MDSFFYILALVTAGVFIIGVVWHVTSFNRMISSLSDRASNDRVALHNERKLFVRLLRLVNTLNVKASITMVGNKKLLDNAQAVASDLEAAHARADSVDTSTAPAGAAADAASRSEA